MRTSPLPLLALSALVCLSACSKKEPTSSNTPLTSSFASSAVSLGYATQITLTSPLRDSKISSPLTVSGVTSGNWFFEGTFPVHLLDANGKEIASGQARAQGDWMTTELVPFNASITFKRPSTPTGTLVIENDNPSGKPELSKKMSVPVRF